MKHIFLSLLIASFANASFSQKKVIDHTVYNEWKTLKSQVISSDGNYVSYEINPHRGDGFLYIYNVEKKSLDSISRGYGAKFSGENNYLVFKIRPGYDTIRNSELNKVDKKKWPKDSLGILLLKTDSLIKKANVKSFEVNENSDWMYYISNSNRLPSKKKKKKKKKKGAYTYKSTGKVAHLMNPAIGKHVKVKDVKSAKISENGSFITYVTHHKSETDSFYVNVFKTSNSSTWTSTKTFSAISMLTMNEQETKAAFLNSRDTAKVKNYRLSMMDLNSHKISLLADTGSLKLNEGDNVSINYSPKFTEDSKYLYFGAAKRVFEEPKDTLLKSEKAKLDIWHHNDRILQPQQLVELKRDLKETDLYVYHLNDGKIVRLGGDTLLISAGKRTNGNYILGSSKEPYIRTYNWSMPWPRDYYLISLETGEATLVLKNGGFGAGLSPTGRYLTYFDSKREGHYIKDLENDQEMCVTCGVDSINWQRDVNGAPRDAGPLGTIGWTRNEESIWIQSEFDIWSYSINDNNLSSVTSRMGELNGLELRPYKWSYDSTYIDLENVYIKGFDVKTKSTTIYGFEEHIGHLHLNEYSQYDANISSILKAKKSPRILYKRMTFLDYPDLYLSDIEFANPRRISIANAQISDYKLGTVELIDWTSYAGDKLQGLLYKPEDFDPSKKYPLLLYFYELKSDGLHSHFRPKPTASIIYAMEYVSAGYVVFMPDIRYKEGHPGRSAYDCIMSGTDRVIDLLPNIDTNRIGLQGQSWGGYQIAQLVTMTSRYRAAMAGAPVANMFSAYGGIRWNSGLNRQFQYEKTQSRIGHTIWERPDLYVENSPIFHLPNVTTPLMIMHNDADGSVPWYQGIELFTGLRRLGKTAWLLNYNDDDHNLMKNANRMDLSIRMRQFFDYYLLDKDPPQWLIEGLPATLKGKEYRY
jgi:dipeptidyl aminopeptidase/acylaminoacyl peptidase